MDQVIVPHLGGLYVQVLEPLGRYVAVRDKEDFQSQDQRGKHTQNSPHYGDMLEEESRQVDSSVYFSVKFTGNRQNS